MPYPTESQATGSKDFDFGRWCTLLVQQMRGGAVFFIDTDGVIATWNPGVEHLLGYPEHDWIGQPASIIFTPEDIAAGEDRKELTAAADKGHTEDVRWHVKRDGSRIFVNGLMQALREENGSLLGFAKFLKDATERQLSLEALNASRERFQLLAEAIEQLGRANGREEVLQIINASARKLTGADGISVVLRDNEDCYYVAEDAIAPLWAGRRFPMFKCISGWAMTNQQTAIVCDVFKDERVPKELYEPTFVRSLVTVPVGGAQPSAAIGAYWKDQHHPTPEEVAVLEMLARAAGTVLERTATQAELTRSNEDLLHFAHIASHDLQAPLRIIKSYAELLSRRYTGKLDSTADEFIRTIVDGVDSMQQLTRGLLQLAEVGNDVGDRSSIHVKAVIDGVLTTLQPAINEAGAKVTCGELPAVRADRVQLLQLFSNLLSNALRYRDLKRPLQIRITAEVRTADYLFAVEDNGLGIDRHHHEIIFSPLKRLHGNDIPGTGIGLAVCKKIVERHGGRIWVESVPGQGSRFLFTLPKPIPPQ